jgi:hypothetical protein
MFVFYKVVGAATLLVEKKFIHECGQVGRVEDVVVSVRITSIEDPRLKQLKIVAAHSNFKMAECCRVFCIFSHKNFFN